jgi:hypothetical protein
MTMKPDEVKAAQEVVITAHRGAATVEQLMLRMRRIFIAFMFIFLCMLGVGIGVDIGVLTSIHSTQASNTKTVQGIADEVNTINHNVFIHNSQLGEVLGVACQLIEASKTIVVPPACKQPPA